MINEFRGKYYFLSNFYSAKVVYEGLTFQNNEAAFQSAKCIDPAARKQFTELNPSEAKRLGRHIKLRSDWEQVKVQIMEEVCKAKFDQNDELREKLLATGNEPLEEGNTWGDRIWGTVGGVGQNHLGKILMALRKEYQDAMGCDKAAEPFNLAVERRGI